jgi:predicted nucleotidyltransferase
LFRELCAIIDKTSGVAGQLKEALSPLVTSISLAVLYGSVAKGTDRATSDIDLLIVADDVPLERLYELLEPVEQKLARRVSPTMYTTKEFRERRAAQNPFLTKVLSGKHIILLGTEGGIPTR